MTDDTAEERQARNELAGIFFDTPSHVTDEAFNKTIAWVLSREAAAVERERGRHEELWGILTLLITGVEGEAQLAEKQLEEFKARGTET